jgi:hypothetical protein
VRSAPVDTEGLRDATVEENSTIAPCPNVVKQFVRAVRVTPAMEAGNSSHGWSIVEVVGLLDAADKKPHRDYMV